jgi:hypothetical protein
LNAIRIVEEKIHEVIVWDRRVGRHIKHDPRSKAYPAPQAPTILNVQHTSVNMPLNQGIVGCCTADATCGALNSQPNFTVTYSQASAITLYVKETTNEGQPYPAYDPGGSGLEVCKAAVQLDWIQSYGHAFGLSHALKALVLRPIIIGINWYSSFDTPASNGVVSIAKSAFVRGGHELCADGIDNDNGLIWMWQSWGAWGLNNTGRFAMSFDTLEMLLDEKGDVTVPIKNIPPEAIKVEVP